MILCLPSFLPFVYIVIFVHQVNFSPSPFDLPSPVINIKHTQQRNRYITRKKSL